MTVIWAAIESEKSLQCLCRSLWMLLLFASGCQSVTDCDVEESAPAPHWPCHIPLSPISIPSSNPSIPSCFSHRLSNVCLFASHCTTLHPPPIWSPQKRLIQEGWAGVSELLLLCPMRCFHSTFLLLCCFYGPDRLTVQVAQSDVIQSYQLHKGCLFSSLKGRVWYLEFSIVIHVQFFFQQWYDHREPLHCPLTNH